MDIAFGDAVTPGIQDAEFPTLLDLPAPYLRTYPRETVVAEKFEAMVRLGIVNSRMKDFYDLWNLARTHSFDGSLLSQAFTATFEQRGTQLPSAAPVSLTRQFLDEPGKQRQWSAFMRRSGTSSDITLEDVVNLLARFLIPPAAAASAGAAFDKKWPPGGHWP